MGICCARCGALNELWGLARPLRGKKLDALDWKGKARSIARLFIVQET